MKRYMALFLSLLLILLSGCGSESGSTILPTHKGSAIENPTNALERILYDGVMTVAVSPDYSPMEFVDSSKSGQEQYVGFDISLASYIAQELGVTLQVEPMGYDSCRDAVYGGSLPIAISGFLQTQESDTYCEVSRAYYARDNSSDTVLLLRQSDLNKYTAEENFVGVAVGVQKASLQEEALNEQLLSAKVTEYAQLSDAVSDLLNDKIEALAISRENASQVLQANGGLVLCSWQLTSARDSSAFVVLIQKGETELLAKINELLTRAEEKGLYEQWYREAQALSESSTATVMVPEN